MTLFGLAVLGCRLLGLYFVIQFVFRLAHISGVVSWRLFGMTSETLDAIAGAGLISAVAYPVLGFALLVFPKVISRRLIAGIPGSEANASGSTELPRPTQVFWIRLLGLWLLITNLSVGGVYKIYEANANSALEHSVMPLTLIFVVKLVLSAALFFYGGKVSNLIDRMARSEELS